MVLFVQLILVGLAVTMADAQGKKQEKINMQLAIANGVCGGLLFFYAHLIMNGNWPLVELFTVYIVHCITGFLMVLILGTMLSKFIKIKLTNDIFNEANESFPQEERLIENEYSVNLPAQYNYKEKICKMFIHLINPFRALLIIGSAGAGKSYFVIRHIIHQHIRKQFALFVFDFK